MLELGDLELALANADDAGYTAINIRSILVNHFWTCKTAALGSDANCAYIDLSTAINQASDASIAPAPESIDSKTLGRYIGRYRSRSGDVLTFTSRDGRLYVEQASAQKPIELSASGEGEFFVGSNRIWFVLDAETRPYGVIIRNSSGKYSRAERIQ